MRGALLLVALGCYDLDAVRRPGAVDGPVGDAPPGLPDGRPDSASIAEYRQMVLDDGAIAYWRFEETSLGAGVTDEVGSADASYLGGAGKCMPGILGFRSIPDNLAAHFVDGCQLIVGDAFGFEGTVPFTVECWFRHDSPSAPNPRAIVGKVGVTTAEQGWRLEATSETLRFVRIVDGASEGVGYTHPLDTWEHVVGVYSPSAMRLYVDGIERDVLLTTQTSLKDHAGSFLFGAADGSAITGSYDECALYDAALTPDRIQAHAAFGQ